MKFLDVVTPLTGKTQAGYNAEAELVNVETVFSETLNGNLYKIYVREDGTKYLQGNGEVIVLQQADVAALILHYVFVKEDLESFTESLEMLTERRSLLYYVNAYTDYATTAEYKGYATDEEKHEIERLREGDA